MIDLLPSRSASVRNDILSGLTVALALVPEAVAFAFVAGVEPLVGFICGLYGWTDNRVHWRTTGHDFGSDWRTCRSYGGACCRQGC